MNCARAELTVERLAEIWKQILKVDGIHADSDFFDLGGDSLQALELTLTIEREAGVELPLTAIYDAPTVSQLAAAVNGRTPTEFDPLVRIKGGDGENPFFIVHGIGGSVIELFELGKRLDWGGPVYAIQARGSDGSEPPFEDIGEMSAFYLAAIKSVQPEGPYFLSGYSFGGLVALEMARALRARDEDVGLLLMIDSYAHPRTWPSSARAHVYLRRLWNRVVDLTGDGLSAWARYLLKNVKQRIDDPWPKKRNAVPVRRWLRQVMSDLPPKLQAVYLAGETALGKYRPLSYAGEVSFVKAGTVASVFPPHPAPIWRRLVRSLDVIEVEGNHRSMLHEGVTSTAGAISACLKRARAADAEDRRTVKGHRGGGLLRFAFGILS